MAEELNRYFASVFTVEDTSNVTELQKSQGAELSVVAMTKEKILGKLKDLNQSDRRNYTRVLKAIAEEIVEILVVIFQESLESLRVAEDWKLALCVLLVCTLKDELALDRVQRTFRRMSLGIKGLSYEEQFRTLAQVVDVVVGWLAELV
eukprot:g48309.t1